MNDNIIIDSKESKEQKKSPPKKIKWERRDLNKDGYEVISTQNLSTKSFSETIKP
jgi:hypothetical protein